MSKKKESVLHKDITHIIIGTLAVFGLAVSSFTAILGVAALGVHAQVAFAQYEGVAGQSAAVVLGDNPPPPPPTMHASSTQWGRPPMASSTPMFCPQLVHTIMRGNSDATTTGDVTQLQRFIANHYNLDASSTITGYFGSTTQAYLERFQQEEGIPPAPQVGPLTRAAIANLCGGPQAGGPGGQMGSSTPMMHSVGSSTPPMHPPGGMMHEASSSMGTSTHPMPPHHPTPLPPPPPVSIQNYEGASNAAAVVSAFSEISDGYNKLLQASISLLGL